MKTNKKYCKKCGAELTEVKAKKCPECGTKISSPIFKKWWFWVIVVLGLFLIGSAAGGEADDAGSDAGADGSAKYEVVEIQTMIDDLKENSLPPIKTASAP